MYTPTLSFLFNKQNKSLSVINLLDKKILPLLMIFNLLIMTCWRIEDRLDIYIIICVLFFQVFSPHLKYVNIKRYLNGQAKGKYLTHSFFSKKLKQH